MKTFKQLYGFAVVDEQRRIAGGGRKQRMFKNQTGLYQDEWNIMAKEA
jgi:hypothetical protein